MPSTSPRYSLGGRLNDPYAKLSASTPGPAQYNPEKPRVNRATRLHGRVQDIDKRGNMPGPGAYGNPDMTRVKTRPPAFSLGGRPQTANSGGLGPGPGNYNPRKPGTSLAYSMTPRREGGAWTTNKQQPGPGAYSPYDSTSAGADQRKAGMGIGPRFNYSDKLGPGPGAYQPNLNKGSPAYTMTARRSGDFGGRRMQPGPGAYSPKTEFVLSSSPRCSLHSRLNTPAANLNTPGPNHYNAVRPNTAPAVTLKGRIEPKLGFVSPGPNMYQTRGREDLVKPKSPAYSLGRKLPMGGNKERAPGPGEYETAFTFVRLHDTHF